MSASTPPSEIDLPTGRSAVYTFLTHGFAFPSDPHVRRLVDDVAPVLGHIQFDDAVLGDLVTECLVALDRDLPDLAQAHQQLFTIIEPRDCPTYETAYRGHDIHQQSHVMADVAGFYRAHGLSFGGPERERPDHIAVELEFMSFLTAKEAVAHLELSPEEVGACRHAQHLFLTEHLGTWAPGFGRRVQMTTARSFYQALGALLAAWVEADMSELGVDPRETLDQPLPPPPPDDGACGINQPIWPVPLQGRPQ